LNAWVNAVDNRRRIKNSDSTFDSTNIMVILKFGQAKKSIEE
jgi:hypothetical protein